MFSGGDSSEGLNNLNPMGAYGFVNQIAVSNAMASGKSIDWAQLAQQWIQMRDNAASNTSAATNMNEVKIDQTCSGPKFEEKGEADMDMDEEEQQSDEKLVQKFENNLSPASGLRHNNINQTWFFSDGPSSHLETQPTSSNQWCTWSNQDALQQQPPINSDISNPSMNTTSHIPSLLKMNVPHPNEIRIMQDTLSQPENTMSVMDSAKRKVLPAWIREGLEKMEREKQRQLEKEKQKNSTSNKWSDDDSEKTKDILLHQSEVSGKGEGEHFDEECSDNESSIQNIEAKAKNDIKDVKDNNLYSLPVGKTYEQKLEDLMTVVRRTLTELLLETTNEEISKIAEETVKLFKSKASSALVIQKSALSTITGKLGLAAYADSSSEENTDDEGQYAFKKETYQSESDIDSEEELRNTIRTKRRAFVKISDEIEERVSLAAAREEEKLKYFSRKEEEEERKKREQSLSNEPTLSGYIGHNNKGYEKDFGEITETKIQNFNGKRQKDRNSRKERTTRFSDNKDSKYVALTATASYIANMNATGATGSSGGGGSATTGVPSTNQRQNIPDINGLLPNYTSTGMKNVLNAADAALEKVLKRKSSESPKKSNKRYNRSRDYTPPKKRQRHSSSSRKRSRSRSKSNSTTTSSSLSSTTSSGSESSRSSHHSKYSHRSSTKHKSYSSSSKSYNKSHKDHRNYSSSSHTKKDRGSKSSSHYSRNASSDSDDEYSRRRKRDSHYSRNSSFSSRYNTTRNDREHSRSLSRSSYSSSSNRRQ